MISLFFFLSHSGETGIGKSTLMDSLFNTRFESTPSFHSLPKVQLKAHTYELKESSVKLKVSIYFFVTSMLQFNYYLMMNII